MSMPRDTRRRRFVAKMLRHLVIVVTLLLFLGVLIVGLSAAVGAPLASPEPRGQDPGVEMLFFWGVGCPHCERAKPFVRKLDRERADLRVSWWEVKKDEAGRRKFIEKVRELKIQRPVVPTFVCG